MNVNNESLNDHIAKLIEMLEAEAAANSAGNYNFVPDLITAAKAFQAEVVLSPEELAYSTDTQQRQALGQQLADLYHAVIRAYTYKYPEDTEQLQAFKRRQKETDAELYERMINEFSNLPPEFVSWFEADTSLQVASFEDTFDPWAALVDKELSRKEVIAKIQKAIDLKAMLSGVLRMYELSDFEIRSTLVHTK